MCNVSEGNSESPYQTSSMTDDSARVRLTGGTLNRVAQSHPNTCHHCGYFGAAASLQACVGCGVRAHAECLAFAPDGRCDACRWDCTGSRCVVCDVPDDDTEHDTDRLIKRIVYHGRAWVPSVAVGSDVSGSITDVTSEHLLPPQGLPWHAPMHAVVDGTTYASTPAWAHTWCIHCALQHVVPPPLTASNTTSYEDLMATLARAEHKFCEETRVSIKYGVRNEMAGCVVCGATSGVQSFCFAHTNCVGAQGCRNCHWPMRSYLTYHSFHPSCAVRAGMYRMTDAAHGGVGMMCHASFRKALPHVHGLERRTHMSKMVEFWLPACSGVHMDLVAQHPLDDAKVALSPAYRAKGRLYTSQPPTATTRAGESGTHRQQKRSDATAAASSSSNGDNTDLHKATLGMFYLQHEFTS